MTAAIPKVAARQPRPPVTTEVTAPSQLRDQAGLELAELRPTDEEHHVHAHHPAAQPIGRFELTDQVPEDHADRVGGAGRRQAQET